MKLIPIIVECHSGYKSEEYPMRFFWENIMFEIKEISDRWYQTQPSEEWSVADYFKVFTDDNRDYIIKHELKSDQWFLVMNFKPSIPFSFN